MFVDPTGKRRRLFKVMAVAMGVFLCLAVAILAAGFLGATPGTLPGLPQMQPFPPEIAEVTKSPQPIPTPAPTTQQGPPATPPGQAEASPSDKPGKRPTHTPSRPHPGKTK